MMRFLDAPLLAVHWHTNVDRSEGQR
jgi:hypothetical protein